MLWAFIQRVTVSVDCTELSADASTMLPFGSRPLTFTPPAGMLEVMKTPEPIQIAAAKDNVGNTVTLRGWSQTVRNQGKIGFIIVRDVTGLIQAVVLKSAEEAFAIMEKLTNESVISLTGEIVEAKQAP